MEKGRLGMEKGRLGMERGSVGIEEKAFAMALGLTCGILFAFIALVNIWFDWGKDFITLMADFYPGYSASFSGAGMGFFWGSIDFFVWGYIVAFLYNRFRRR